MNKYSLILKKEIPVISYLNFCRMSGKVCPVAYFKSTMEFFRSDIPQDEVY